MKPQPDRTTTELRDVSLIDLLRSLLGRAPEEREELLRELEPALAAEAAAILRIAEEESEGESRAEPGGELRTTLPIGTRCGDFEILELIGSGGMGDVYRARQGTPERDAAVKVMRPTADDSKSKRRFITEINALARLDHPDIARVYCAGWTIGGAEGRPWFAMELVDGVPITEWCRHAKASLDQRLRLFCKVAHAVGAAHDQGVIHRDLKPSNVLVTDDVSPRVIDFGIARIVDRTAPATASETSSGALLGTLAYAAPEQLLGSGSRVDVRADVYSLAVILYELACGRRPHVLTGLSLQSQLDVVTRGKVIPPVIGTRRNPDLKTVIMRAMSPDPNCRYATPQALAEDINRILNDEPILTHPTRRLYVAWRFLKRRRRILTAIVAASVVLISLVSWGVEMSNRRHQLRQDVDELAPTTLIPKPAAGTSISGLIARYERTANYFKARLAEEETDRDLFGMATACCKLSELRLGQEAGKGWADMAVHYSSKLHGTKLQFVRLQHQALVVRGNRLAELGDRALAQVEYRRADSILNSAKKRFGDDLGLLSDTVFSLERLADQAEKNGELEQAKRYAERQYALSQRLVESDPDNPNHWRGLRSAAYLLGVRAESRGLTDESLRHYRDAVAAAEAAKTLSPTDLLLQRELLMTHYRIVNVLRRSGDLTGAKEALQEPFEDARVWVRLFGRKDPAARYLRARFRGLRAAIDPETREGDLVGMTNDLWAAHELRPAEDATLEYLINAYVRLAKVAIDAGDSPAVRRYLDGLEKAAGKRRHSGEALMFLAETLSWSELGPWRRIDRALAVAHEVIEKYPKSASRARDLIRALR